MAAKSPKKLHGLVIFYRNSLFKLKEQKVIEYDLQDFDDQLSMPPPTSSSSENAETSVEEAEEQIQKKRKLAITKRAGSRQTRNIGLLAALERVDEDGKGTGRGVVVGTTHL